MQRIYQTSVLLLFLCWIAPALADIQFPALSNRIVDNAHLLSAQTIMSLTQELAQHEEQTSDQLVIVTLRSLQGYSIEEYGYRLGRQWGIGQKGKDNGVLLIVAPVERQVRIEVGYGLEGKLTDLLCGEIIRQIILPAFRAGHLEEGVVDGAHSILAILGGAKSVYSPFTADSPAPRKLTRFQVILDNTLAVFFILLAVLGLFIPLYGGMSLPEDKRSYRSTGVGYGTYSGGSVSGGGFSGGGGGFGGGGCSGGW